MRNKYDVVQLLIAYNANITAVDFQGRTALHCAARHGAAEVIEVLSHSKDDDWPRDESNMTALHHACIGGDLHCVINLIRKYPKDLEAADEDGRTAVFYSAQVGHLSVCTELLDRGANVNVQDRHGRTPLMCAAENGNRLIAELFVSKGAKTELCDEMGRTACWYAMDGGHTAVKQAIDPSPPLAAKCGHTLNAGGYPSGHRIHSPIMEENEPATGEMDTLPLRLHSTNVNEIVTSDDDVDNDVIVDIDLAGDCHVADIRLGGRDSDRAGDCHVADIRLGDRDSEDEFKGSTITDSDDDGSISPRLSQLSYTMSHVPERTPLSHAKEASMSQDSLGSINKMTTEDGEETFALCMTELVYHPTDPAKPVIVTDLDAVDCAPSLKETANGSAAPAQEILNCAMGELPRSKHVPVESKIDSWQPNNNCQEMDNAQTPMRCNGISLSSNGETEVLSRCEAPAVTVEANKELENAHITLKTNYDSLKAEYEDMLKKIIELENCHISSREEEEMSERMDMVIQLSELSSKLDDEQSKNRQLQAQINTLESLAADGGSSSISFTKQTDHGADHSANNWLEYAENDEESDDEFGFPGLCLLNTATGKQIKDDAKPVAKVSARPRQISIKEENKEIAKLKCELESVGRQKHLLTEALTQLQSKYEESEHKRKKLISELDVSKTTIDVKSQQASKLLNENVELDKMVNKYKDEMLVTVDRANTYRKEMEKLRRKLELYDKEYSKVKERLRRRNASEKRMLKDRHSLMRKMDEMHDKLKESKKAYEELRQANDADVDELLVACEELQCELAQSKQCNEDQLDEIEKITDLINCSEEMLYLKQLEVQSLEKQINLFEGISLSQPQTDNDKVTNATIKSLQNQVFRLQTQLAETSQNYQSTIDIYRNNIILASRNVLGADVKDALLHIVEVRKITKS